MAFDPAFLEELRQRLPLASVIGKKTKLVRSGRNWKACCPFHGEKTPSFYVYEDHFHCYGCGAHGDVISFVMQSEGRNFAESVESLAAQAGLKVPQLSPASEQKSKEKKDAIAVLEAASHFFQRQLFEENGRSAREYLAKRGVTIESTKLFGLGWSPKGSHLADFLKAEGFTSDSMQKSGLFRQDEATGELKGFFFNRLMFPIVDRSFRPLSFGGRLLGEGQPKYLNGPETEIFSKRTVLFGLAQAGRARKNAHLAQNTVNQNIVNEVMVVEGYMDVISLHQAGFVQVVAPLGTALTIEQFEQLWRLTSVPVLCFDGDAAGRKAALRAVETALPYLTAEQSLRLCLLPEGEDPDSLVGQYGQSGLLQVLEQAQSLAESMFLLLKGGVSAQSSPEEKARLKKAIGEFSSRIHDKTLSSAYFQTLNGYYYDLMRAPSYARTQAYRSERRSVQQGRKGYQNRVTQIGSKSLFPSVAPRMPLPPESQVQLNRKQLLIALVVLYPEILNDVEEALCRLDIPPALEKIRKAVLGFLVDSHSQQRGQQKAGQGEVCLPREALLQVLKQGEGYQEWEALDRTVEGVLPKELEVTNAVAWWWHFYGLLSRSALEEELEKAKKAFITNPDSEHQNALIRRASALRELGDEELNG
ncbi:DNA primase [Entomobacter blattae]|uniref:DNA primase n=1 Tax=Entomobacter blattae TaxID=2762277 RepID=A0A7H1NNA9_9PROT|nr:DNA primase [Entomobacter blattae]QNT77269.1 DNA primase [Entomobacter blattae]